MSIGVVKNLIDRGHVEDKDDALEKLQSAAWLIQHGYGHVAHVLSSQVGIDACIAVFADSQN